MSDEFRRPMEFWVREIARATGYNEDDYTRKKDLYRFRCPVPTCPAVQGTLSLRVRENGREGVLERCSKGCSLGDIARSLGEEYDYDNGCRISEEETEESREQSSPEKDDSTSWLRRVFRGKNEKETPISAGEEVAGRVIPSSQGTIGKTRPHKATTKVGADAQGENTENIKVVVTSGDGGSPKRPSSLLKEASPQPLTIVGEGGSVSGSLLALQKTGQVLGGNKDLLEAEPPAPTIKKEPDKRRTIDRERPKEKAMKKSLSWWFENLNNVKQVGDGWKAECPSHDDQSQDSLHINEQNGEALIHCFAGCEYEQIIEAIEGAERTKKSPVTILRDGKPIDLSPEPWWTEYTGVPWEEWESWGCRIIGNNVAFTWEGYRASKLRSVGTKDFRWEPDGGERPPLWPKIPDRLPRRIYLCEGESDTGILRHLGLPAFGIMKGAGAKLDLEVYKTLKSRGVDELSILFDADDRGDEAAFESRARAIEAEIDATPLNLRPALEVLRGGKDLRDLWLRVKDKIEVLRRIESLPELRSIEAIDWEAYTLIDAVKKREPTVYAVEKILPIPSFNSAYGSPGEFKSLLFMELAICIAFGIPWLRDDPNSPTGVKPFRTTQVPVLWVDFDNGLRRVHERFEALLHGRQEDRPLDLSESTLKYVSMPSPWLAAQSTEMMMDFAEYCRSIGVVNGVVFFDVLRAIIPGVDENSPAMGDVASNFRRLSEEINCGLLTLHHPRKGSVAKGGRESETYRGHSAFMGALDLALKVERAGQSLDVSAYPTKARGASFEPFNAVFSFTHKTVMDRDGIEEIQTDELEQARFYGRPPEVSKERRLQLLIRDVLWEHEDDEDPLNKTGIKEAVREKDDTYPWNLIDATIEEMAAKEEIRSVEGPSPAGKYYRLTGLERSARELSEKDWRE